MDYSRSITETDPFHNDMDIEHILWKNLVIGLETVYTQKEPKTDDPTKIRWNFDLSIDPGISMSGFDCETKEFIPKIPLEYVPYSNLKNKDCFMVHSTFMFVVDVENKQYSKSNQFPFMISENDGNHITACKTNDKIYIFHSYTSNYETGVFIFDLNTNTFNNDDFQTITKTFDCETDSGNEDTYVVENFQTNNFIDIHEKTITDCYVSDNKIYLAIDGDVYLYENYKCILLLKLGNIQEIRVKDDMKIVRNWYENWHLIHYYKGTELIKTREICVKENFVSFWDIYEDKLIVINFIWKNPYGQIYTGDRSRPGCKLDMII